MRAPTLANAADRAVVPEGRLYVEHRDADDADKWFVHVGRVTERGRWRTAPHTHPKYGQLIFVRRGQGALSIEGQAMLFQGPCMLLLPAGCVHGIDYELDADRWVVTIHAAYLAQVNGKLPDFMRMWAVPRVATLAGSVDAVAEIADLIERLVREIAAHAIGHIVATEALLTRLQLVLLRGAHLEQAGGSAAGHGGLCLVERFRALIERHYRDNLSAREYASMMAVSLTQLRSACAAANGQSPSKMVHARLITEAKRSLIFGDQSIEQISYSLGFSHASYFSRFFGKEVGQTPGQFRRAAREGIRHAGAAGRSADGPRVPVPLSVPAAARPAG